MNSIKAINNWYWEPKKSQHIVIVSTHTIFNPCLDISVVIDVADIPRSF